MKVWIPAAAATLALAFSATASAASGTVTYQCQNNEKVSVNYVFNKQGIPTQATATLQGKKAPDEIRPEPLRQCRYLFHGQ